MDVVVSPEAKDFRCVDSDEIVVKFRGGALEVGCLSPKAILAGVTFSGMARQRTSSSGSGSWFDPSQVFADTQRVDLFNDPPWESTPPAAPRRAVTGESRAVSWWTMAKTAVVNRVPTKRGLHSTTS